MKKIIFTLFLGMLVHAAVLAQPKDRRQGPPPPPRDNQRKDDQRRNDRYG